MPDGTSTSAVLTADPAAAPVAAPAPAAGAPAAPVAAPPPAPASAITWLNGADELTTGFVANKGWKEPGEVVRSYRELESLIGAERAGRTVVMPKEGATPEEIAAFHGKLGRPTDPAGYNLPVPEGGSKEFATAASAKFHELGIPQGAGQKLAEWINGVAATHAQATAAQVETARAADDVALRAEWGAAFDQNLMAARTAVKNLGVQTKDIDAMALAIGHKATMALFAKIGSKTSEDALVLGNSTNLGTALTPGQAKSKINDLMADKEWTKRYLANGVTEKAEMQRLQAFANPEEPK